MENEFDMPKVLQQLVAHQIHVLLSHKTMRYREGQVDQLEDLLLLLNLKYTTGID